MSLIDEFLKKETLPWGMSREELISFQAEVKTLKEDYERVGRLCDKLNKDYFEQKEFARESIENETRLIRELKILESEKFKE